MRFVFKRYAFVEGILKIVYNAFASSMFNVEKLVQPCGQLCYDCSRRFLVLDSFRKNVLIIKLSVFCRVERKETARN